MPRDNAAAVKQRRIVHSKVKAGSALMRARDVSGCDTLWRFAHAVALFTRIQRTKTLIPLGEP